MAFIPGDSDPNTLIGGADDDLIQGLGGNDFIDGAGGNDTLEGGDGDDYIVGGAGNDTIDGGDNGTFGDFVDYGSATSGVIVNLTAGSASDGLGGTDTLSNIEHIQDSAHNDVLTGNAATNWFRLGAGDDTADGAEGVDVVMYETAGAGVTVNLQTGVATGATIGTDTLISIEAVHGTQFDDRITLSNAGGYVFARAGSDTLIGGSGNDLFFGGSGNDTISGAAGFDTASYFDDGGDAAGPITQGISADLTTGVVIDGWGNTDTLSGIENIVGSQRNDTIVGDGLANSLVGEEGDDTLNGEGGDDTLIGGAGFDFFVGGPGNDTIDGGVILDRINYTDRNAISYASSTAGINLNLQTGIVLDGLGGTDTLTNIDFITGSSHADVLTGSSAEVFEVFEGGAGDDVIDGGAITDIWTGTNANRASYATAGALVLVDLAAGTASGAATGTDTLININHVVGSAFADQMFGSDRTDVTEQFWARAGNDFIDGRGGLDVVRYDAGITNNGVTVNLATGQATDEAGNTDTFVNIEGVRGSNFNDTLLGGNAASDELEFFAGLAGNDLIDGGSGFDRADYNLSTAGVAVTLGGSLAGTAQDGQGGTDTLISVEGVRGSIFGDTLTGSDDAGIFETFEGREGNDTIDGGGGVDRAVYFNSRSAVNVNLGLNGADGLAMDGTGGTDTLRNIEDVLGTRDFGDVLVGNEANNTLDGVGGSDLLMGLAGDDTLKGGADADTLFGGDGADTLYGFDGPSGQDPLGLDGADTLHGGAGNDTLRGNSGDDMLYGEGADDNLRGDAGNDLIDGGDGIDSSSYRFDQLGLSAGVTFDASSIGSAAELDFADGRGGIDHLVSIEFALIFGTAHGDILTGSQGGDQIIGAAGNDRIFGGAGDDFNLDGDVGDDFIDGGAGNDTLIGGAGNDTLIGGAGIDGYFFAVTDGGGDRIEGYEYGEKMYWVGAPDDLGQYRLRYDGTDSVLDIDTRGNGSFDLSIALPGLRSGPLSLTSETIDGTVYQVITVAQPVGNRAPVGAPTAALAPGQEDHTYVIAQAQLLQGFTDPDADPLAVANLTANHGNLVANSDDTFTFTPDPNYHGAVIFNYAVIDGNDGSIAAAQSFDLESVNDQPIAVADSAFTARNSSVLVAVRANDTDVDTTDVLSVTAVTNGARGSVSIDAATGDPRYTPRHNFAGVDSFSYTLSDGNGGTSTATVSVTVTTAAPGNDDPNTFTLTRGRDVLAGLGGDDTFLVAGNNLTRDTIIGGAGNDTLKFTDDVTLRGPAPTITGVETLDMGGNALFVNTMARIDLSNMTLVNPGVIIGGSVANRIVGTQGADRIFGGDRADRLDGGAGNDFIGGGQGNDVINGGAGNDRLFDSAGRDTFVFNTALDATTNVDTIFGFNANSNDRIALDPALFTALAAGTAAVDLGEFRRNVGGDARDANDFVLFDTATGNLFYDADGNGAGAKVQFAKLIGLSGMLDASDFTTVLPPGP